MVTRFYPIKSMYGWTIYKKKPVSKGMSKFCVGTGDLVPYMDFKTELKAEKWLDLQQEHIEIYKKVLPPKP